MELRRYLAVLRRQRWLVLEAFIVVVVAAVLYAALKQPLYDATARVLLLVDDPAAGVTGGSRATADPERNAAVQAELVTSPAVAQAVAASLGRTDGGGLAGQVSVEGTDILEITATDPDPVVARDVANGFARAYIEDRRQNTVATLQRASDELEKRLELLRAELSVPVPVPAAPATTAPSSDPSARSATAVQYQTLYERQQELLVAISLERGGAELVAEAGTPIDPAGLSLPGVAAVGAIVALALGLAAAFLRDQFDDRLRTREEVQAANGLPVLAELPLDRNLARDVRHLAAYEEPWSAVAEAARGLRTSISFLASEDAPLRRVLVASPAQGEGKTLVAANLAVACAQAGPRTILVSGDLRAPGVESIFGLSPSATVGFTNLIAEAANAVPLPETEEHWLARGLVPTQVENLWLLPAGLLPPNPAELLASRYAKEVLDAASEFADLVIIDSAPIMAVTDTLTLTDKVDGVLLVNYLGRSNRRLVERTRLILEQSRVKLLGVVLNGVREPRTFVSPYQDSSRHVGRFRALRNRREARPGEPVPSGTSYEPVAAPPPFDGEAAVTAEPAGEPGPRAGTAASAGPSRPSPWAEPTLQPASSLFMRGSGSAAADEGADAEAGGAAPFDVDDLPPEPEPEPRSEPASQPASAPTRDEAEPAASVVAPERLSTDATEAESEAAVTADKRKPAEAEAGAPARPRAGSGTAAEPEVAAATAPGAATSSGNGRPRSGPGPAREPAAPPRTGAGDTTAGGRARPGDRAPTPARPDGPTSAAPPTDDRVRPAPERRPTPNGEAGSAPKPPPGRADAKPAGPDEAVPDQAAAEPVPSSSSADRRPSGGTEASTAPRPPNRPTGRPRSRRPRP